VQNLEDISEGLYIEKRVDMRITAFTCVLAYTKVVLASTSMYRHGLETRMTERLSTSHMLIVIKKT
jgi:hypothetical protein